MAAKKTTATTTISPGTPILVSIDGAKPYAQMHVERVPCVGELLRWYGAAAHGNETTRLYLEVTRVLHIPREAPVNGSDAVALVWATTSDDPAVTGGRS
jgi:hypothetical protein